MNDSVKKAPVDKSVANAVSVTAIKEFIAKEQEFSIVVRAGGMNNGVAPSPEAVAAKEEAIAARIKETGFDKSKAGNAAITKEGDLKLYATAQDMADVKFLMAEAAKPKGEPRASLTYPKDYTYSRKGADGQTVKVEHKAGDKRVASAVALLLRNNGNAIHNSKTGATGLDAVNIGEKQAAFVYLKVDTLIENAGKSGSPHIMLAALKEGVASTMGNQAKLQIISAKAAREASKKKEEGIAA